jgi:hypothetical protein
MVKRIVILSHARSGTSRLKQLFFRTFNGFPKIDTELFKKNNTSLQNFLTKNEPYFPQYSSNQYAELLSNHNFKHEDPIGCLNQLSKICFDMKYKYLLFKVTPNIFNYEIMQLLAKQPNIQFLFITRNILDTYISLQKALLINKWNSVDTSNIILKLDEDKFLNYHKNYINWVKSTHDIIKTSHAVNFYDYNNIYKANDSEKRTFLNLFKSYVDEADINLTYIQRDQLEEGEHRMQDTGKKWSDKISNSTAITSLVKNKSLKLDASFYLNE